METLASGLLLLLALALVLELLCLRSGEPIHHIELDLQAFVLRHQGLCPLHQHLGFQVHLVAYLSRIHCPVPVGYASRDFGLHRFLGSDLLPRGSPVSYGVDVLGLRPLECTHDSRADAQASFVGVVIKGRAWEVLLPLRLLFLRNRSSLPLLRTRLAPKAVIRSLTCFCGIFEKWPCCSAG